MSLPQQRALSRRLTRRRRSTSRDNSSRFDVSGNAAGRILSCRSGIPLLLGKPKSPVLVYVALGVLLMLLSYLFIQARHNPIPAQLTAPLDDHQLQDLHACDVNLRVLNLACRLRRTEVPLLPHDFAKAWIGFRAPTKNE